MVHFSGARRDVEGLSSMRDYVARLRRMPRAIQLFLVFLLLANIGFGVFQLIFNLYLVQLGYREDFIGTFSAFTTVAMAVTAVAMGPLIDRFTAWGSLLAGTLVLVVATIGQVSLTAEPALLAAAVLGGVGQAGLMVPVMPFIIEQSPDDERADVAAITFSVMSLALTAGSLVGGRLPALLVASGRGFALESVTTYRATLLTGIALTAVGLLPLMLVGSRRAPVAVTGGALFGVGHLTRRVKRDMIGFIVVGALLSASVAAVVPFYNVYLQDLGADTSVIGTVFAIGGALGALLGLTAPALGRRFGVFFVSAGVRFAGVPLIALLLVIPSLPLAFVAQIVRVTVFSMAWPVESNFVAQALPPRQRATTFSLRSAAWNFVWALTSFVVGRQIVVSGGYQVAFVTSTIAALLALGYFALMFHRHPLLVRERAQRVRQRVRSRRQAVG